MACSTVQVRVYWHPWVTASGVHFCPGTTAPKDKFCWNVLKICRPVSLQRTKGTGVWIVPPGVFGNSVRCDVYISSVNLRNVNSSGIKKNDFYAELDGDSFLMLSEGIRKGIFLTDWEVEKVFSVLKRTINETLHLSEVKNGGDEAIFRKTKIKTFLTVIFWEYNLAKTTSCTQPVVLPTSIEYRWSTRCQWLTSLFHLAAPAASCTLTLECEGGDSCDSFGITLLTQCW